MAGGLSIHAYDVSRGIAAAGLRVEVKGPDGRTLLDGTVDSRGVLELADVPATGLYEATFHVGDWYRAQGVAVPTPAFLEAVPYRFGIADLAQHYHLPLKMTPWGFSLFRGGA
ncbi:MAG: hydroxyisourate hydrolase [Reyranellaceae bacterium]